MYFADIYDKLLYITILCSSFFITAYTLSMNKTASHFKLLGLVFFAPFAVVCIAFAATTSIQASLVLSLSELCLSAGILSILSHPYNIKNHSLKTAIIVVLPILLGVYSVQAEQFIYYSLSVKYRSIITAVIIAASILYINRRCDDKKFIIPLSIWLAGVLSGLFEGQPYIKDLALVIKLAAYAAFSHYFYSKTYGAYMKKIDESEQLIEKMERSLHKEVKKRTIEIERSNERLLEISKTDLLTKALNKITILNVIERLIANKREEVFSILMFDIDDFKAINDSFGHVTGDMCLKILANIASGNIREVDFLGRYGGDEFIIVLPSLSATEAKFVAERFKKKVNETSNPKFTVSIGIATYPQDGETVKDLISSADKGLYRSKGKGKNAISHGSLY